jgi:hypothetical protein
VSGRGRGLIPRRGSEKTFVRKTAQLGEVVVTVFDKAVRYSTDPRQVSRLAAQAIALILRQLPPRMPSPRPPSFFGGDWS